MTSPRLLVALCLGALLPGCASGPPVSVSPEADVDPLIGLWAGEVRFSEGRVGPLVLEVDGSSVSGSIDGRALALEGEGSELWLVDGESGGYFRGRLGADGRPLGHWVHPTQISRNYPVAVPVAFSEAEGSWQGDIPPYQDAFRFYLWIEEGEGGALEGYIRNPERNAGAWFGSFTVSQEGESLTFLDGDGDTLMSGTMGSGDRGPSLALTLPIGPGVPLSLRPTGREPGGAFYPTHSMEPYQYAQPQALGDGWTVDDAASQGLNAEVLARALEHINQTDVTRLDAPMIHSLLIARHGALVLESYFYGYDGAHLHDTRSAGKSIASMVIGTVVDRVPEFTMDRTIASIIEGGFKEPLPDIDEPSFEARSRWRQAMTVGDALSMQSGLDADDNNRGSLGGEGRLQNQEEEGNWVRYLDGVPMVRAPGTQAVYGSVGINLAAASAARVAGQWLPEIFGASIAQPLNIKDYAFNLDPSGQGYMGGGIRLTPRDLLKLGQVMLDDGAWAGEQVLSAAWVEDSTAPKGGINEADDYAYGWWRKSIPYEGRRIDVIHASGNGGQFIVIIPEFDMVIQLSGGNYGQFGVWYPHLTNLLPEYIFPAIEEP